MTPNPAPDPFDEITAATIERIERFGFTATIVGTGECAVPGCTCQPEPYPYAYSLGMCEHDRDEYVVFGVPSAHLDEVLHAICRAAIAGEPPQVGRDYRHTLPAGAVVSLVAVPDLWVRRDPGRVGSWINLYDAPPPQFIQICWADRDGRLPWESGCDAAVIAAQPILADDALRIPRPPRHRSRHPRGHRKTHH